MDKNNELYRRGRTKMGLFKRKKHNALLYIAPIDIEGETTDEDKTGMLYCDEDGQLVTSTLDTAIVDWMEATLNQMVLEGKSEQKGIAWVQIRGIGIKEQPATVPIEISSQESNAIGQIIQMAQQGHSQIPAPLKAYVRSMVLKGEQQRKKLEQQYQEGIERAVEDTVPEIVEKLEHLSFTEKKEIKIELKPKFTKPYSTEADLVFPVIMLEWLDPLQDTPPNKERLLVLDAEEDLAILRVDKGDAEEAKQFFDIECRKRYPNSCLAHVLTMTNAGLTSFPLEIRRTQELELVKLKEDFFRTGQAPTDISLEISTIIAKAKVVALTFRKC